MHVYAYIVTIYAYVSTIYAYYIAIMYAYKNIQIYTYAIAPMT